MPYASNADLPAKVKKAHPTPHAQRVFREAFNAAAASGKYPEADLFRIAHSAADKVSKRKRPAADPAEPKAPAIPPPPQDDGRAELRRYLATPGF